MRASFKEYEQQRGYGPPEYLSISMEELAQQIIIHSDEERRSMQEMRSRVQFALTLDSTCVEAYLLEGYIEQRQAHHQKALASYERGMQLSMERLGPDALARAARKEIHFWHSTNTRPYMQARAAIAYLLWQKLGKVQERGC
jgi:hypothetical protein